MNKKALIYISFLWTFLIIMFICDDTSYAASQFEYTVENGYATITAYKGTSPNIIVPNVIDKYKVVAIGKHAFDQSFNPETNGSILKSVTISSGIVSIGDFAFVKCENLTTIKLPDTVRNLGDQTFIGCSSLKNINIPEGVQTLGYTGYMFQETGLETITIPRSVTKIPFGTFRICKKLKTVKILSKNVEIADDTFEHCSPNIIIYGYNGSSAQEFAKVNNMKFIDISNAKTPVPVSKIALYKQHYTMTVGKIIQVKARVSPKNATNKNLIYKSANPKIAYINNKGYMKAMAAGSTTICVASADGRIKAYAKVTITASATTKEPIPAPTMVPITPPTSVPTTAPTAITEPGTGINPPDIIGATPEPALPVDPTTSATPPIADDMPTTGSGDTTTGASDVDVPDDTTLETTPTTKDDSSSTNMITMVLIALGGIIVIAACVIVIKKKRPNN